MRHGQLSKILQLCETTVEWGVHKPDCKIITDAHDCGLAHDNLIFVTTDNEMLEKIVSHDTSFLEIIEFMSCT